MLRFIKFIVTSSVVLIIVSFFLNLYSKPGDIGQTWDWGLPFFRAQFDVLFNSAFYVWKDKLFAGRFYPYTIELPYYIATFLLSRISENVARISIVLILLTSLAFSSFSIKKILHCSWSTAIVPGILYSLSPYVYSRLIAGHLTLLICYALFPLVLYLTLWVMKDEKVNFIGIILLSIAISITSLHIGGLILSIILVASCILFTSNLTHIRTTLVKVMYICLLCFILMSYWLLPTIYNVITYKSLFNRFETSVYSEAVSRVPYYHSVSQSIDKILTDSMAFGLHTEYVYPLRYEFFGQSSALLLYLLSFFGIYIVIKTGKIDRSSFYLLIMYVISFGIVSGDKTIIGNLFYIALSKFLPPVFAGFSNPLRFLPLLYIFFSLFLGIFLKQIYSKSVLVQLRVYVIIAIILLFHFQPWILNSLYSPVVENSSQPLSLKSIKVSDNEKNFYNYINKSNNTERIVFLPPSFLSWTGDTNLSIPWTTSYYNKPAFLLHMQEPLSNIIFPYLMGMKDNVNLTKILSLASVGTIVVPDYKKMESYYNFIPGQDDYKEIILSRINKLQGLVLDKNFDDIRIYKNIYSLPRIYVADSIFTVGGDKSIIVDYTSFSNYKVKSLALFDNNLENKSFKENLNSISKAEYAIGLQSDNSGSEYLYEATSRFLPSSPLYQLQLWKDARFIANNSSFLLTNLSAEITVLTKRMFEISKLNYSDKKYQSYLTNSLIEYSKHALSLSNLMKKIDSNNQDEMKICWQLLQILKQHFDLFSEINNNNSNKILQTELYTTQINIKDLMKLINSKVWINSSYNEAKLLLPIVKSGSYSLYLKDDNSQNVSSIEFMNSLLSSQDLKQSTQKLGDEWIKIKDVFLDKGNLRIKVHLSNANLQDTNVIELSSKRLVNTSDSRCANLKNLKPFHKYFVNLKYFSEKSNIPLEIQSLDKTIYSSVLTAVDRVTNADFIFSTGLTANSIALCIPERYQVRKGFDFSITSVETRDITPIEIIAVEKQENSNFTNPSIEIQQIAPTKYLVNVSNAINPYYLVFTDSFHEGWKVSINKDSQKLNSTFVSIQPFFPLSLGNLKSFIRSLVTRNDNSIALSEALHIKANGYANAWKIPTLGTYQLIIEFYPQKIYLIGIVVSSISYVVVIVILFFLLKKQK